MLSTTIFSLFVFTAAKVFIKGHGDEFLSHLKLTLVSKGVGFILVYINR